MDTHWIELLSDGSPMPCYVAVPDEPPKAAVIVLQEIFGVNEPMMKLTELVASAGYLAIAPALFHRTDPNFQAEYDGPGFAKGAQAAGMLSFEKVSADMTAAAGYAHERLGVQAKIATWGFCLGGSLAMLSATLPFVSAAVSFYGGQIAHSKNPAMPPVLSVVNDVKADVFFAFGGMDQHITTQDHDAIREAFGASQKTYELHVYPHEDHGFFRQGPDGNDGSRQVWPRVRHFLAEHLS